MNNKKYSMPQRTAEVLRNDMWVKSNFDDIKAGDRFRLFEPDGTAVAEVSGQTEWTAEADAKDGVLTCVERIS